jgi:hypothetical protein
MSSLVADCFALCCTAKPFARSADFAIDKPPGTPGVNPTDLSAADLSGALFLTQAQVNSARGDERTRRPERLGRPAHRSRGVLSRQQRPNYECSLRLGQNFP